jgi:hypothetical protein
MDSNPCVDSVFHQRRFTEHGTPTAEDNRRQSFAPSVTTVALLNRNTSGKTTHTPQLEALRLDNPSLQKASRHE